jgi:hypothetical protein
MSRRPLVLALLTSLAAGCGAQAGPDYEGQPLAVLRGTLTSAVPNLPPADLVLAWPDETKGDGVAVPFASFSRVRVDAQLPATFEATVFEPPPETAYHAQPATGPALVGPRFTSAIILLAKRDANVTTTEVLPGSDVLATFTDDYLLTYYDGSGDLSLRAQDGTLTKVDTVTKGFHLMKATHVTCSKGVDQACLDAAKNPDGTIFDFDRYRCSMPFETTTTKEVPLTSMDLEVKPLDAPLPTLAPCP